MNSDKKVGTVSPMKIKRRKILESKDIVNKMLVTDLLNRIEDVISGYVAFNDVDLEKDTHKHNLAEDIYKKIVDKSEDIPRNVKVLKAVEERLNIGQLKYGKDIPIDDGRDWLEESIEEALDNVVYLTNYLLQIKEKRDAGSNSNN